MSSLNKYMHNIKSGEVDIMQNSKTLIERGSKGGLEWSGAVIQGEAEGADLNSHGEEVI